MKKTILVVFLAFLSTSFFPSKALPIDPGLIMSVIEIGVDLKMGQEKENEDELMFAQGDIMKSAKDSGNIIKFKALYEKKEINSETTLFTFNGTWNNVPAVIPIAVTIDGKGRPDFHSYKGYLVFNVDEYNNLSKKELANIFLKYNVNLGPVENDITTTADAH